MLPVARSQNLSSEGCQQKSPTDFVKQLSTHTVWKCCLWDYVLITDYLSAEVLIGTQFVNCHINSTRYIDRQVEFNLSMMLPLGSAPDEFMVKGLESMERDYSGPNMDKPTWKVDFYSDIIRDKASLCKHIALLSYT